MADTYIPEWARDDSPTRNMTHAEMVAYYKANSVKGDVRFALRAGTDTPEHILAQWRALLEAIGTRKERRAHRLEHERITALWRGWIDERERSARTVTRAA